MPDVVKITCARCSTSFYRERGRVNENLKLGHNFYCSRTCEFTHKAKRSVLVCENQECKKEFIRVLNDILTHNYCSRRCAAHVNNVKFPKRKGVTRKCAYAACANFVGGGLTYCSVECRTRARQPCTKEDLIRRLQEVGQMSGRTPTKRESPAIIHACIHYFGSWNNAIAAAGLRPNRSHSQLMYKRVSAKALDGHVCDSVSEAIIDNWLTNHGILHRRDVRYPETNHLADWQIQENVFVEYFGFAEDSPRYDRAIRRKRNLCCRHDITLIEIYPRDLYPEVLLDEKLKNLLPLSAV